MILKCINTGTNKSITEGLAYELVNETETRYSLINDKGIQKNYSKDLFEEVVVNNVKTVSSIELQCELEKETNYDDNECRYHNINVTIKVIAFDGDDVEIGRVNHSNNILQILHSDSRLSCGIKNLVNISDFSSRINWFFDEIDQSFVEAGLLVEKGVIRSLIEDHKICFYEDMLNCIFGFFNTNDEDDHDDHYGDENIWAGILQVSTNLNNPSNDPKFIQTLDKLADSTLDAFNQNSSNNIRLWNFNI